jgi:hypothetical protein
LRHRIVLEAFVNHLRASGHPGLLVDRRPEEESPGVPDIDVIAGRFAIEHANFEALADPEGDSRVFQRAAGSPNLELPERAPSRNALTAHSTIDDADLPDRLRLGVERRASKLLKYQWAGKTTILLIESDDIALRNGLTMLEALRVAFPDGVPGGIDQIWHLDTSIPSVIQVRNLTPGLRKVTGMHAGGPPIEAD